MNDERSLRLSRGRRKNGCFLSPVSVKQIKQLLKLGHGINKLAKVYAVNASTISRIANGITHND